MPDLEDTPDLDELMSRDPLSLADRDIDSIVAYFRRQRAMIEGGVKPRKTAADGPKLDLAALGLKPSAPAVVPTRRRV